MKTLACAMLLSMLLYFNLAVFAAVADVPLPSDAVKVMEKSANMGPSQSFVETYETSLSQDKVNAFYKKEMARSGWREQKMGLFLKEGYMALVAVMPRKDKDNKTRFVITTSRIPAKEEILAMRKDAPDKLDFMPVYPGSAQVFLWDMPTGTSASYETERDINEVMFFYKSGMLNYGWSLANETPITTENIDCPECRKAAAKLPKDAVVPNMQGTVSKANLMFRRGNGENCIIRLSKMTFGGSQGAGVNNSASEAGLPSTPINKTMILVTYNANKKIHP